MSHISNELLIKIRVANKQARSALKAVTNKMSLFNRESSSIIRSMRFSKKAGSEYVRNFRSISDILKIVTENIKKSVKSLDKLSTKLKKVKVQSLLLNFPLRLLRTTIKMASLAFKSFGVALSLASAGLKVAGFAFSSFIKVITFLPGVIGKVVGSIFSLRNIIVAFLAIGAFKRLTESAIEFEKQMINVSTLVDTTTIDMSQFEGALKSMAKEVRIMPTELVKAFYQSISSGARAGKEALDITRDAAILASAGLSSTSKAVDVLTDIINAYGLESSDATRITDVLFKTVELGKITIEQLTQSFGLLVPVASSLGIGIEEISAAVATLTKGGFRAPIAVTALNTALVGFIKSAKKFKRAGVDILEVIDKRGLAGALGVLKVLTKGNIEQIREFIQDQKGLRAVAALAGNQFEEYNRILALNSNASGAAAKAHGKQKKSINSLLDGLKVKINILAIDIGTKLFPAIERMVNFITKKLPAIRDFGITFASALSGLPEIAKLVFDKIKEIIDKTLNDNTLFDIFFTLFASIMKGMVKLFVFTMKSLVPVVLSVSKFMFQPLKDSFALAVNSIFGTSFERVLQGKILFVKNLTKDLIRATSSKRKDSFLQKFLPKKDIGLLRKRLKEAKKDLEDFRKNEDTGLNLQKSFGEAGKAASVQVGKDLIRISGEIADNAKKIAKDFKSTGSSLSESFGLKGLRDEINKVIDDIKKLDNLRSKFVRTPANFPDQFSSFGRALAGNNVFGPQEVQGPAPLPLPPLSDFIKDLDLIDVKMENLTKSFKKFGREAVENVNKSLNNMPFNVMKGAVDSFSASFVNMASQGKLNMKSLVNAVRQGAAAQIASIGAQLAVIAVWQTALGFAALATGNPRAGFHFTSAAIAAGAASIVTAAALVVAPKDNSAQRNEDNIRASEAKRIEDKRRGLLLDREGIKASAISDPGQRRVAESVVELNRFRLNEKDKELIKLKEENIKLRDQLEGGPGASNVPINFIVNSTSLDIAEDSEVTRLVRNKIVPALARAAKDVA